MSHHMESQVYVALAQRTDLPDYSVVAERAQNQQTLKLLHASMGLSTEANEALDTLKKSLFYGKPVDLVNFAEELGDACWYIALALRELNMSFEDIMNMNINKLEKRFPEAFSDDLADNRDLEAERASLERDFEK